MAAPGGGEGGGGPGRGERERMVPVTREPRALGPAAAATAATTAAAAASGRAQAASASAAAGASDGSLASMLSGLGMAGRRGGFGASASQTATPGVGGIAALVPQATGTVSNPLRSEETEAATSEALPQRKLGAEIPGAGAFGPPRSLASGAGVPSAAAQQQQRQQATGGQPAGQRGAVPPGSVGSPPQSDPQSRSALEVAGEQRAKQQEDLDALLTLPPPVAARPPRRPPLSQLRGAPNLAGAGQGAADGQANLLGMMPEKRAFLQSAAPPGVADAMAAGALVAASGQERSQPPGGLGASMLTSPFADSQLAMQQRAAGAIPQVKDRHEKPDDYWTMNHLKLMYLISRYSHFAQSVQDKERWIRKLPLLVLIYEGVVQKVFDYDYAPSSEVIEARRVYINISQEGKDDLDDLTEGKMIKGLRLSTKEHQSVTAYQITLAGVNMISKRLPDEERQLVDDFIFVDGQQLQVAWEEGTFLLRNDLVSRESTITECEDVSYVSSPHIPRTLRRPGGPSLSSNAHRAHESAGKVSTIRDDLDEVITLSNVTILVGEWLPFGANQIVELNIKLGANERCQGGYFTSTVDQNSTATQFEVPTGLTQVRIVDYDLTRFTNIEAEVYFPEEEGIVQIECFGIHARLDGTLVYGMLIEAVMDRILENISLDNLARLLVDVHIDSSKIMESLISNHQRDLLDMVFLGNTECRDKVNCIIAERVLPKRRAAQYMDRDAFENEIRQVLGDTYEGYDLTDEDVIVTGSHGIMVTGPNAKLNEPVLLAFLSLRSRDVFVQNLFSRLFIVDDTLKTTRKMINEYERDPNSIPRIRRTISETSKDIILLEEILLYLSESLSQDRSIYQRPSDPAGVRLYDILDVDIMIDDLKCVHSHERAWRARAHERRRVLPAS